MHTRRSILGQATAAALLSAKGQGAQAAATHPALFFYPPPARLADGSLTFSPVTVAASQITEAFPQISEMAGVVLVLYWSRLAPTAGQLDVSIIEHALRFWGDAGKSVVLDVATFGQPMVVVENGRQSLRTPTPEWVLSSVKTFTEDAPVISPVRPPSHWERQPTSFPSYWDRRFLGAVSTLVRELARYDGHPALSKVRIATGILGEDNPTFDGLKSAIPDFSNVAWLHYCRQVTDIYLSNFTRTQLEFDLDRVGWIYARGTPADRGAADEFVAYLTSHHVFLAMDGFDTQTVAAWHDGQSDRYGPARNLDYLHTQRVAGKAIGVEGAPLFNPHLADVETLAAAALEIGATRLVLFADVPGVLNYRRTGASPQNALTIEALSPQTVATVVDRATRLLRLLGYVEPRK